MAGGLNHTALPPLCVVTGKALEYLSAEAAATRILGYFHPL